jgi:hypothetical protein
MSYLQYAELITWQGPSIVEHALFCLNPYFSPQTFRQCLETGHNNRVPTQSYAYNSFTSMRFMMEISFNNKHSDSIIKFHNYITAILLVSTFIMIAKQS